MFVDRPYDTYAQITITRDAQDEMAVYGPHEARRRIGIESLFAKRQGLPPRLTLVDLPTACGKTSWALAAAAMLLGDDYYPAVCRQVKRQKAGDIFQGTPDIKMARLALVASGGSTFSHFHKSLLRLLPNLERLYPDLRFEVWSTVGKRTSVEEAYARTRRRRRRLLVPPRLRPEQGLASRRASRAVCIIDEYTVDTQGEEQHRQVARAVRHPPASHSPDVAESDNGQPLPA